MHKREKDIKAYKQIDLCNHCNIISDYGYFFVYKSNSIQYIIVHTIIEMSKANLRIYCYSYIINTYF